MDLNEISLILFATAVLLWIIVVLIFLQGEQFANKNKLAEFFYYLLTIIGAHSTVYMEKFMDNDDLHTLLETTKIATSFLVHSANYIFTYGMINTCFAKWTNKEQKKNPIYIAGFLIAAAAVTALEIAPDDTQLIPLFEHRGYWTIMECAVLFTISFIMSFPVFFSYYYTAKDKAADEDDVKARRHRCRRAVYPPHVQRCALLMIVLNIIFGGHYIVVVIDTISLVSHQSSSDNSSSALSKLRMGFLYFQIICTTFFNHMSPEVHDSPAGRVTE